MPQVPPPLTLYKGGSAAGANSQVKVDEFKCTKCNIVKAPSAFSETQKRKYSEYYHNPYAPGGRNKKRHRITCKSCTPMAPPVIKRQCARCHQTKSLQDGFSKAQRKNGAKARCIECMAKRAADEPDFTDSSDDSDAGPERAGKIKSVSCDVDELGNDEEDSDDDANGQKVGKVAYYRAPESDEDDDW